MLAGSAACSANLNLVDGNGGQESAWPGGIMLAGLVFIVLGIVVNYVKNSKTWKSKPKQMNSTPVSTSSEASSGKGPVEEKK